jgi:hypothetical protein
MKVIIGLLVVCAIGGVAIYYGGGYANLDPDQQGKDAKAKITPGVSWKKVVDVAGNPLEWRPFVEQTRGTGANKVVFYKEGPANKFSADVIGRRVADGKLPKGFTFHYRFSNATEFDVKFDDLGNVEYVTDRITAADLLQMDKK